MLKKLSVVLLCCIGLLIGVLALSERIPSIQEHLCVRISQSLEQAGIKATVKKVYLLSPCAVLEEVELKLEEFSCRLPHLEARASWLMLLFYQQISLSLYSDHVLVNAVSEDGKNQWMSALKQWLELPSPLPISLGYLKINHLDATMEDKKNGLAIHSKLSGIFSQRSSLATATLQVPELELNYGSYAQKLCDIRVTTASNGAATQVAVTQGGGTTHTAQIHINNNGIALQGTHKSTHLSATYEQDTAQFTLTINAQDLPIAAATEGTITCTGSYNHQLRTLQTTINSNDLVVHGYKLPSTLHLAARQHNNTWHISLPSTIAQTQYVMQGVVDPERHSAKVQITSSASNLSCTASWNADIQVQTKGTILQEPVTLSFQHTTTSDTLTGSIGSWALQATKNGYLLTTQWFDRLTQSPGELKINLHEQSGIATCDLSSCLRLIRSTGINLPIVGTGKLTLNAQREQSTWHATARLTQAQVRHKDIIAPLQQGTFSITYTPQTNKIDIKAPDLVFERGTGSLQVTCTPHIPYTYTATLHAHNLVVAYLDNTVQANAMLTFSSDNIHQKLSGQCSILNATIDPLILTTTSESGEVIPLDLDLLVTTEHAIPLEWPAIRGQLKAQVHIEGTLAKPIYSGEISFNSAEIPFALQPLHVTECRLHLSPKLAEPELTLRAQTRIKQHEIRINAVGPISHPTVYTESASGLSSEQVMALLISGTTETGPYTLAPSLIFDQLLQFAAQKALANHPELHKYVQKALHHVKFTPFVRDRTVGQKVEIELNKRLHASIEQELNGDPIPSLSVDYQLTDEIAVKAAREHEGDVSAELEMRFKF